MFWAQSTTRDYIRAEGDFHKERHSWKDQIRQTSDRKNRVRKWRVVGRLYEMKYSWKGHEERDRHKNRIERSKKARLFYVKNINGSIPSTLRWARGDPSREDRALLPRHFGVVRCYLLENYATDGNMSAIVLCESRLQSPSLIWSLAWTITSRNSGRMAEINIPKANYSRLFQN